MRRRGSKEKHVPAPDAENSVDSLLVSNENSQRTAVSHMYIITFFLKHNFLWQNGCAKCCQNRSNPLANPERVLSFEFEVPNMYESSGTPYTPPQHHFLYDDTDPEPILPGKLHQKLSKIKQQFF